MKEKEVSEEEEHDFNINNDFAAQHFEELKGLLKELGLEIEEIKQDEIFNTKKQHRTERRYSSWKYK